MFKFNFEVEKENVEAGLPVVDHSSDLSKEVETHIVSEEVENGLYTLRELDELNKDLNQNITFKKLILNDYDPEEEENQSQLVCIEYADSSEVNTGDESLDQINQTHDLVPGKYEGGLKVWELSIDMARLIYNLGDSSIVSHPDAESIKSLFTHFIENDSELRVLELGCGHALPSLSVVKLLSLLNINKKRVKVSIWLQDFNKNIIKTITYLNAKRFLVDMDSNIDCEFKFVYGDWSQLVERNILPADYFNLILTSETIYNSENYKHLLNVFKTCMTRECEPRVKRIKSSEREDIVETSLVLLAAKTYYFGCGGNMLEFLKLAKSSLYSFNSSDNLLDNKEQSEAMAKEIIKLWF